MEFKFRAIDDRTPPYRYPHSPSRSMNYISEQALRVDYTMDPNLMHNPRDFYTIQREIEKERIRHEIIMAENMHRQLLEEEVRRELMMEREMARASEMSLSIDESLSMRLPASCQFNNRWLEDPFTFPGNRGMGFGHDALPPTRPPFSDAAKDEFRNSFEVNKKDKLIMLAKPDPNLCGAKRKAITPPAGSGEFPLMSSKKPKEWSCALCQVSATSERGLNEHLQGKKHKAKQTGLLRAQRMCNNSTSPISKKSGKQIKLTESGDTAGQEMKTKVEEESIKSNKTVVSLGQKMEGVEDTEYQIEELPKKKGLNAKTQKKKYGILNAEKTEKKLPNRKKYKFWCEDCQVGTHSAVVMECHKWGKKHLARRDESKPNGEAVPATTTVKIVAPSEPTRKAKDEDVAAAEANEETAEIITEKPEDEEVVGEEAREETTENVTGDSVGTGSSIVVDVVHPKQQTP